MLLELRIENLLLIERAELRLGPGLNAITGETGAGKTILAHSFDLLMGGKARSHIVRPGAAEAYVEGVFELPEGLLGDPELAEIAERLPEGATEVAIGRRVSASGRTSAFLAGRSASAPELQALGSRLLAFYGQHEHRKLTLSGRAARDAGRLRRRGAPGAAPGLSGGARRGASGRARAGSDPGAGGRPRARSRHPALRAGGDRGREARSGRGGGARSRAGAAAARGVAADGGGRRRSPP